MKFLVCKGIANSNDNCCLASKNLGLMTVIDLENFDRSIAPGESFYRHVNGNWLKKNQIPAEFSSWSTFRILDELSKKNLKSIFDELEKEPAGSSLIAELYKSGMDTEKIEKDSLTGIADLLEQVDRIENKEQAMDFTALMHKKQIRYVFFVMYVSPDSKKSNWTVGRLHQSGLGLPNRDFYFDESKKKEQDGYKQYISDMFEAIGTSVDANLIYDFETKLAEFSLTNLELRDPIKTYNKVTLKELHSHAPTINWARYFELLEAPSSFGDLVIHNVDYFSKLSQLLVETDISVIRAYLKLHLLTGCAPYLSDRFESLHFKFFKGVLTGVESMLPRWKRVLEKTCEVLRDPVSELYVAKFFPPEAKKHAAQMVQFIIAAVEKRLKSVDWMQDETKQRGLKKLANFRVKIGYPDKWIDFTPLKGKISHSNTFVENILIANEFDKQLDLARINKEVDREKWEIPPYMVNAYFHPMLNEIVFPAAILQPPFFYPPSKEYPMGQPALNFGGIGAVIGHEITHGYDDKGRQYNHEGNLDNWWTDADGEEFTNRAKKIVNQFSRFQVLGKNVNGALTQGENIADLGGLSISFAAFQEYMKQSKEPLPKHHDFTQEQQFFISWAQCWRMLMRDQDALSRLITDVHSPCEFRVDGILCNMPEFHEAFGIKEGETMFAPFDDRVKIWN
jgi:putative endopeptidase